MMPKAAKLTRRLALAGGALASSGLRAAENDRQRIELGKTVFMVPKAYLFDEFLPPGTNTDGLPPRFSFAFTAPNGAPAGVRLEFPPLSHPFVLERDGGQFLVMCYRVEATSNADSAHTRPRDQLANFLLPTTRSTYSAQDNDLVIKSRQHPSGEERYVALLDRSSESGIEAFFVRIEGTQLFSGAVEFEKPGVTAVVYIPVEHHTEIDAVLTLISQILMKWRNGNG